MIRLWLDGANNGEVANVKIRGDALVHYSTVIAQRYNDKIILNYTRYSIASGRVQKILTDSIPRDKIIFINGIKGGYMGSLTESISKL